MLELDTQIKNIKVLVVEDMALNQLLMKTLLDDFGFEVGKTQEHETRWKNLGRLSH